MSYYNKLPQYLYVGSGSKSRSGSRSEYWSGSGYWSMFRSGYGSRSWSGSWHRHKSETGKRGV
jgi:hypothetical protein